MPAPVFTPLLTPLRPYAQPNFPSEAPPLVVGVSGGADSVALLRALLMLGVKPVVAHLDHQLRPESGSDAAWVRQLCADLGVECVTEAAPVARVAALRGWTTEEGARRLRYAFLARVAKRRGAKLILTAHTQNDQAETVLWQLLRGEAVLSGISPQRGPLHRPWLGVSRNQLAAALTEWQQLWLEDASNSDTHYTRNWLRAEVLPLLRSRFAGLDASLSRLARFQAEDATALEAASHFSSHAPRREQPPALLRRAVRRELQAAGLPFHAGHLEQLAAALNSGQTQHLTLPDDQAVSVIGGPFPILYLPGHARVWSPPSFAAPPGWTLRHRQSADRMHFQGGTRKLSDVLTDLKIPRAERDAVWLLADEGGVQWLGTQPPLWAVGAREQAQEPDFEAASNPDAHFMDQALDLARTAAKVGEVPVGAVVVSGEAVIARAANRSRELGDMTRHAELDALRLSAKVVGPYLNACTLYVTLEPCPMCLGAMLEARLGRVVYAASNPRAGALGGVSDLLAQRWGHSLSVTPGVRASQAARLLKAAFREFRSATELPDTDSD